MSGNLTIGCVSCDDRDGVHAINRVFVHCHCQLCRIVGVTQQRLDIGAVRICVGRVTSVPLR